jgi:hypothetical protein
MKTRDKSDNGALPNLYIAAPPAASCPEALGYLLINGNHDEGHQPHIALENDSPLCCRNTRGKICTKIGAECHVNLHHRRMIIMRSIAPKGAYCRIMALKLMLRAALRYFSDSERSELDKCDIPRKKSKSIVTASCIMSRDYVGTLTVK